MALACYVKSASANWQTPETDVRFRGSRPETFNYPTFWIFANGTVDINHWTIPRVRKMETDSGLGKTNFCSIASKA